MNRKLVTALAAAALAALVAHALTPGAQTQASAADKVASVEQDAMILARQGLMDGIYQYVEDADDWTDQKAGADDAAMLRTLSREAAHMALVLPAFKQLFPPVTNPENPNFASAFDTYALPAIWTEPDRFVAALDATIAAINILAMARDRAEFTQRLQTLQATCEACHDHFRRVYVSPFDTK
jgi:cytochrome c556